MIMSFTIEQNHSVLQTYHIAKTQTVHELLKQLNLEDKFFAVLVNGKRAKTLDTLRPTDEVVLLPKIAGG